MPQLSDSAPAAVPGGASVRIVTLAGLAGLMVVTLASPGATRMYGWPWSVAYWVALLAPVLLLLLRAGDTRSPWTLPSPGWLRLAFVGGGIVLASALASPFRGASLRWGAPLVAASALFLVLHAWLHAPGADHAARRERLLRGAGFFLLVVALTSFGLWLADIPAHPDWRSVWLARNGYPLGHSNYTAGLTLLMLPCFAALAVRADGRARLGWTAATLLAVGLLFTSGSRGGFAGLGLLALVATPAIARRWNIRPGVIALAALGTCALLFAGNPRIRELLAGSSPDAPPNASSVQRGAMFHAGLRLGSERPLLGWGPGSTPLAYPRVRAGLEGGTENVLQLHSLPVQLWAELGAAGLLVALAGLGLALQAAIRSKADLATTESRALPGAAAVLAGLSGYLVFSLTDWQLDLPVFAAAAAVAAALLAPAGPAVCRRARLSCAAFPALAVALVGLLGRPDPTPVLNVNGLVFASHPATAERAVSLLRESLALNPDQEIAHFNLGWLLVVTDPAAAEQHFLAAARLVPDKGGVWFGLGLARLNRKNEAGAARALALEALNDPVFLFSPWWKTAEFTVLRRNQPAEFQRIAETAAARLAARGGWIAREARHVAALTHWALDRTRVPSADTSGEARAAYFRSDPAGNELEMSPINAYNRERTGYPVLMRRPDLPPPSDLLTVQENATATGPRRFLFPEKGWLPSPLLLELSGESL